MRPVGNLDAEQMKGHGLSSTPYFSLTPRTVGPPAAVIHVRYLVNYHMQNAQTYIGCCPCTRTVGRKDIT